MTDFVYDEYTDDGQVRIEKPFDWAVIPDLKPGMIAFKILSGEFENMVAAIGNIQTISPADETGEISINFDYDVAQENNVLTEESKDRFEQSLGDMLMYLLAQSVRQDASLEH